MHFLEFLYRVTLREIPNVLVEKDTLLNIYNLSILLYKPICQIDCDSDNFNDIPTNHIY